MDKIIFSIVFLIIFVVWICSFVVWICSLIMKNRDFIGKTTKQEVLHNNVLAGIGNKPILNQRVKNIWAQGMGVLCVEIGNE